MSSLTHVQMVLTWVIQHLHIYTAGVSTATVCSTGCLQKTHPCILTHLHQLDHIRMVELLEDGDLLVHPFQGAFELRWTLRSRAGPSRRRSSCLSRIVYLRLKIHTAQGNTHTHTQIHLYIHPTEQPICYMAHTYVGSQPAASVASWTGPSSPVGIRTQRNRQGNQSRDSKYRHNNILVIQDVYRM